MSFASSRMTLLQMQEYFISQLDQIDIISDLQLSEEDYRYLATKVKMLFKFANNNTVVDDYKLSIVVYWVFSMVYWDKQNLGALEMDSMFEGLPQYKKKYYMNVCMETFHEYGLYTYPVNYEEPELYAKAMIAGHAGIPKDEMKRTFEIISEFLNCTDINDMVESIMMELPERTQTIYCCFDDLMKQQMILNIRNLMIACMKGPKSKEVLQEQFSELPLTVVNGMLLWCDSQENRDAIDL